MTIDTTRTPATPDAGFSRRHFIGGSLAVAAAGAAGRLYGAPTNAGFVAAERGFTFDTGALRGTLREGGKSRGLHPVVHSGTGATVSGPNGLFSHYRIFDSTRRYGAAAWVRTSAATLGADGAVDALWAANADNPYDLAATYRWSAPDQLDVKTSVTARRDLSRFEVFLASYFSGFPETVVRAGGSGGFIGAPKEAGDWQMFPRDAAAVQVIRDGRWKHPPNPVDWAIRPTYTAPLAIRRDRERGLAAVLMARPDECYAVAAPYDTEQHRSVYFCLFGRDLKSGERAVTTTRLRIGGDLSDDEAIRLHGKFLRETAGA